MARSQRKNPEKNKKIGLRFIEAIEDELGWTLKHAASELGYANAATLYAIKRGTALPDPEKLALAAQKFRDKSGKRLDLHWVLTGARTAFFSPSTSINSDEDDGENEVDIINLLKGLTKKKKRALATLLKVL
jgi:transcriptional regulator with XRE-family HTH domain